MASSVDSQHVTALKARADRGNQEAQFDYAVCIEQGQGVEKDETEAARQYKLGADQNAADAQYGYAAYLENGRGVVKDEAEAAGYFKLSTD
jgi:TPR repeat protein